MIVYTNHSLRKLENHSKKQLKNVVESEKENCKKGSQGPQMHG